MKRNSFIVAILFALIFAGCNNIQPTPTYNKDYSNKKVFAKYILVKNEYQAKNIINQLNGANNKLQTFIDLKKSYSIPYNGKPTNQYTGFWYDTLTVAPYLGNTIFEMSENTYFKKPISSTAGYYIFYVEKVLNKQQFNQLRVNENQKNLNRIASYEINYLKEYDNILKISPKNKTTYIQPINKKEPCKVWFGYTEENKWFKEDSYKIFWDGRCKNGYADGLGREIEKDDLMDKWGIAIYKKGIPTYYIVNDVLRNNVYEGIDNQNEDMSYGVRTIISEKSNDIDITTIAMQENNKDKTVLFSRTSPFWNGTYQYIKGYPNFEYVYNNLQNNDEANLDFEFFISDRKNKNGWAIAKPRNQNNVTGEFVENKFNSFQLPTSYNKKADSIIKEVYNAQQKAFSAQEQAQLVKKQYKKRICKDSVKVNFMDNEDYKAICNNTKDLEILAKVNKKLNKISEAKIAKLEQQRFEQQQQKEEQHRQNLLSLERQKVQQQQAHYAQQQRNFEQKRFDDSLESLNKTLRDMTPKTYNMNVFHY